MTLEYDLLCLIPVAIFHRAFEVCAMVAVEVLEYPILVLQPAKLGPLRGLW